MNTTLKIVMLAGALPLVAACAPRKNFIQVENERRVELAEQSSNEMAHSRKIPSIGFEEGSEELGDSATATLDKIADLMHHSQKVRLIIEGNSDEDGTDEENYELSRRRAAAVQTYLVGKGLPTDTMRIYAYGKRRPLTEDRSDAARAVNRRVDFTLTPRDWSSIF